VSTYRSLWTGLGIIAGYGLAVLGLTYYLRDRIGAARWRRLHRLTAVFWLLAVGHTIEAGSDAAQIWFLAVSGALVIRRSAPRPALARSIGWRHSRDSAEQPSTASPAR
jgi:sulfoxide reductase heme-binding subunit YedZ